MKLKYVILNVKDVEASLAFYQAAFGLEKKFIHDSKDYAELDTGGTTLSFCRSDLAKNLYGNGYKEEALPFTHQITFSPACISSAYEQAMSAGAVEISAPEVKPWKFEVAYLRDIDGHIIELAKNLN